MTDFSNTTHFNKLPLHDSVNQIIICSTWTNKTVEIKLLISSNDLFGYQGTISFDVLQNSAKMLEIPFDEFMSESKNALCTEGGLPDFIYQWDTKDFSWRKVKDSKIKIIYGLVHLTEQSDLKNIFLMDCLKLNVEQGKQIKQLSTEFDKFKEEHNAFKKAYEQCVTIKNNTEIELLTKFTVLLNAKKDKIAELQKGLDAKNWNESSHQRQLDGNKFTQYGNNGTDDSESDKEYTQQTKPNSQNSDSSQSQTTSMNLPKRLKITDQRWNSSRNDNHPITNTVVDVVPPQRDSLPNDIFECDTQKLFDDM